MKNIIKIFIIALCLSATACTNNNSSTNSVKTDSSTIEISTSSNVDSIEIDSSNESSEIDSSSISETDSSNESSEVDSEDESSKAVTTTKTIYKETAKATTTKTVYKETAKATTTTKQTTTRPAVTTKPYVAPVTTATKPVVTTKTTTKATAKQTTKVTTKATPKVTSKQTADPTANMSPFMKAMYRVWTGKETKNDIETIRQEYLNYGKSLKPKFKLDKSICLWIGKDGKPTNNCSNGVKGFVTGVASKGSDWIGKVYNCTHQEILNDIAYMDNAIRERIYDNLMYVDVQDETEIRWYFHIEKRTDLYGSYDCFTVLV